MLKKRLDNDQRLPKWQKQLHKIITKTDKFVIEQINSTFLDSSKIIEEQNLKESISFVLWNNFWNHYGIYGDLRETQKDSKTFIRYPIGRKIFVDLGFGNIGKELSLPHPAVVLYNFAETVIIAPTTSDDGNSFSEEMEKAIIKCSSDKETGKYPIFPEDTVINLHQIKVVHKNRIVRDLNCTVQDYIMKDQDVDWLNNVITYKAIPYGINLRECIRLKMMHLFSRENFFEYIRIKEKNMEYNIAIKECIETIKNFQSNSSSELNILIKNMENLLTNQ